MSSSLIGLIGIAILFVLLFLRVPIAFAMGLVGFAGFVVLGGFEGASSVLAMIPYRTVTSYHFAVIPLFVLMGTLATNSGITRDLYYSMHKWVGHFRGGLATATVFACGSFAAITGSAMAGTVTMGKIVAPEMRRYHYDHKLIAGCVAAGGTLGVLIPPSMGFILYGILTEESIGQLFMAGVIPGILEIVFYVVVIFILCRINPAIGPASNKATLNEKLKSLVNILPVIALFGLVMGGIYGGIFTPTEAGAMGAFGALVIGLIMRRLSGKDFVKSFSESVQISAQVVIIIICAFIFAAFMTLSRLPFMLAEIIVGLSLPPFAILAIILIVYILLGCAFDLMSLIIITVPIIFPLVVNLGFDPIWYGVLMVRVMEMGAITPPIGLNSYVLAGIMDVPVGTVFRGIVPFVIADIIHIAVLAAIPQISLFLPTMMIRG